MLNSAEPSSQAKDTMLVPLAARLFIKSKLPLRHFIGCDQNPSRPIRPSVTRNLQGFKAGFNLFLALIVILLLFTVWARRRFTVFQIVMWHRYHLYQIRLKHCGKRRKCRNQHYLLYPQYFQRLSNRNSLKLKVSCRRI